MPPSLSRNLSHEHRLNAKETLIQKVRARGDLPHVSVFQQLELIDQLGAFGLGASLIETGGLNGAWTHYVVQHPTRVSSQSMRLTPLEDFLLNRAPSALATQQRFGLFKAEIQKHVREGCAFASIPSGLMADLLDLDYSKAEQFSLTGIDLDAETLTHAKRYAEEKGLTTHCVWKCADAWAMGASAQFDVIASNGLTIYEPDNHRVVALYREFYRALKPGGTLVTSFMTPPPAPGAVSEWKLGCVNREDALLQRILFVDVLQAKWQAYRPEAVVKDQLREAGFEDLEVLYDTAHIFPTVVARKPL